MTRRLRFEPLESRQLLAVSPLGDVAPAGSYLQNTQKTFSQIRSPAVAMDADGDFTAVWASLEQDGSGWGVYARRFNSQGQAEGPEFQVNLTTTAAQTFPSVAMDADGDFVVTWSSLGQDGSGYGVYARRYDRVGQPLGDEFRVNTWRAGNQNFSAVAMDADGDFVVTWTGADQDGDRTGVFGRRFDATGAAVRGEFRVNSTTDGNQRYGVVAMDADGAFVVTWTSQDQDGSSGGIFGQRFDAEGETQGDEFLVNTTTDGNQQLSSISMTAAGDFVVAWQGFDSAEGRWNTFAQRYEADGSPRGDELALGPGRYVSVAMGEATDFNAVWRVDDPTGVAPPKIHIGHYDPFGNPLDPYYTVGSSAAGHSAPSTAVAADRMVVFWTSQSTVSGESDVLLQRLKISLPAYFNRPPVVSPIANQTVVELQTLSFTAVAIDPNDPPDELAFSLEPGAPTGATIDPAGGLFTWTPTEADGPGRYTITVRVEDDGLPPLVGTASFEVLVIEENQPPELTPVADQTIDEGSSLLLTIAATDADLPAQTLTFSLVSGANTGAAVDSSTGEFAWTPSEQQGPGQYTFEISVTDDAAIPAGDTISFLVTVEEVNAGVTIRAIPDQAIDRGETLSLTVEADDPDVPPNSLVFSLEAGAPAGAVIDPLSGVFTWATDASLAFGDYTVTVRATDDGDPSTEDSRSFQIVVEPPMLDPLADQTVDENSQLTFLATATSPYDPADGLAFSLDPGAPYGASIDPVSGQFTWTPNESQGPGAYRVTIRLSDDQTPAASDSESFTVTVLEVNDAPSLATIEDVIVLAGAPIHVALRATDPEGDPLVFSVSGDNPDIAATLSGSNRSLRVSVADFGQMTFELFEDRVPDVTGRIVELAQSGFYDGLLFHRVASAADGSPFVIQGGDPTGTGSGGSGVKFDDQFHPDLRHTSAGLLSMAHSGDDTNDSQFFITGNPARHLDFNHSVFGFQTDGEDVRRAIEAVAVDDGSRPFDNVVIDSIEVFVDSAGGALTLKAPLGATGQGDITVTVSDGLGGVSQQTFHVTIQADTENGAPYLITPNDVETTVDRPISFTLEAIDVDDDPVYFSAEVTPANGNLSVTVDETDGTVTVTPSGGVTGVYELLLGVGEESGQASDTQSVPLLIRPGPPSGLTLAADSDTGVSSSDRITRLDNTLAKPLQFHLEGLVNGALVTIYADGQPFGQAVASGGGATVVSDGALTLSDGDHAITAVQTLADVTWSVGNRTETVDLLSVPTGELWITVDTVDPVFTSSPVRTAQRGVAYLYDVETDAESSAAVTYELATGPDGMTIHPASGRIDWPSPDSLDASEPVVVRASDTAGNTAVQSFLITLSDVPLTDWLDPIADRTVEELSQLTFTATATRSGDPSLVPTFTLDGAVPAGASIDPVTGVFTWTPDESQGPGSYFITVRVTDDGPPALSDATTFAVDVTEVNAAPTIDPINDRTVEELSQLTFVATAADADLPAQSLAFTLDAAAPAAASIDPVTGVFTWTPDESQGPGSYSITVRVTDDGSPALSAAATFAVDVTELNVAPTFEPIADQTVFTGETLEITAAAADADLPQDTLAFSLEPGSPTGMEIDANTGVITWTPKADDPLGDSLVTVRVSDDGLPPLSSTRSFTVTRAGPNQPPSLDPLPDQTVVRGETLSFSVTTTDPGDQLVYRLDSGPAGASIHLLSGLFRWTPMENQPPGLYDVTIRVNDDGTPSLADTATFRVLLMEPSSGGGYEIGVVELEELPALEVDGETRLTFQPIRTGQVSVEAFFSVGDGDVDLTLFDSNGAVVATSVPSGGGQRLDGPVEIGASYELAVTGANPGVALRLANLLVDEGGGSVVVYGTGGDDTFLFTAGGPHEVTVDGVSYEIDPAVTGSIRIEGGAGWDVIAIQGTSDNETAEFWPGSARVVLAAEDAVSAAAYQLDVIEMATITVDGGGGDDLARWNDSPGDDLLEATPSWARMTGDGFNNRADGFREMIAYSSEGRDLALFTDSPGDDTFTATPDQGKIEGANFLVQAVQFERVVAYASEGGHDTALLYGRTDGDDLFIGDPNSAKLTGQGYYRRARGFEETLAWGGPGGHDTARLTGSETDDTFLGTPTYSELSGDGYLLRATDFAEVHAWAKGGVDTATLNDSALSDLLQANAFEVRLSNAQLDFLCRVIRFTSVTAKSTYQDDNDVLAIDSAVDYLMLEGTW